MGCSFCCIWEKELRSAASGDAPAKTAPRWSGARAQGLFGGSGSVGSAATWESDRLCIGTRALGFCALLPSFLSLCCCFEGYVSVPLTHHFPALDPRPLAVIVGARARGQRPAASRRAASGPCPAKRPNTFLCSLLRASLDITGESGVC